MEVTQPAFVELKARLLTPLHDESSKQDHLQPGTLS
jgi:hypothetical protein